MPHERWIWIEWARQCNAAAEAMQRDDFFKASLHLDEAELLIKEQPAARDRSDGLPVKGALETLSGPPDRATEVDGQMSMLDDGHESD